MRYKTEAFDLWQYLCADVYNPLIRCRIDLDGFIDEDTLKAAVTASFATIPMIRCSFAGTAGKPRWTDRGFSAEDMVCVVTPKDDSEEEVLKPLSTGIDFAIDAQLKIFVVRRHKCDTLCIIVSHLVCDTEGFKQYLYLLSDLYTKLKNNETVSAPELQPRGVRPLFAGLTVGDKLRILRSNYTAYKTANRSNQRGIDLQSGKLVTAMEKRVFYVEEFDRLKTFAKSCGATVNDCLMALFARSFCRYTNTVKIIFPSTIDLRKFIPEGCSYGISNYSSNCMCTISVHPDDKLEDTVAQVSKLMGEHKSSKDILKSVMLWRLATLLPWFFLKSNLHKYVVHPLISYTNLGVLDKEQLRFQGVNIEDAYLTASIKHRPYLQLTASTFDDRCTLGCNIHGSEADQAFVQRLLSGMRTEIAAELQHAVA